MRLKCNREVFLKDLLEDLFLYSLRFLADLSPQNIEPPCASEPAM
jgi:hypothetical protein